jgi:hypothetical protein
MLIHEIQKVRIVMYLKFKMSCGRSRGEVLARQGLANVENQKTRHVRDVISHAGPTRGLTSRRYAMGCELGMHLLVLRSKACSENTDIGTGVLENTLSDALARYLAYTEH